MGSLSVLELIIWGVIMGLACKTMALWMKKKLRSTLTAVDDLPLLGISRGDEDKIQGTALICGGSIAGLIGARVCSDHFQDVVIVEPEAWVTTEEGLRDRHRQSFSDSSVKRRTRVAQYISLHAFQPFMPLALRRLFKNFDCEIEGEGGRFLPADTSTHISGIPLLAPYHQYPGGTLPKVMHVTRPVFETVIRRLLLSTCSNVRCVTASVASLVPHPSKSTIDSAIFRSREGEEQRVPVALVVDCTGPSIGGWRWLQDPAFEDKVMHESRTVSRSLALRDIKLVYDHRMLYTTCEFDVPFNVSQKFKETDLLCDLYDTKGYMYTYSPDPKIDKRVLIITRREKQYLQIACGGWDDNTRVTTVSDIRSFVMNIKPARPLPAWIFSMLDILEDGNVSATYVRDRIPPSVYVQYHRARHLPSNFVALGDAVLLLNPARGLGCTKACVDAVTLNALLSRQVPEQRSRKASPPAIAENFGKDFFALQAKRTGLLWKVFKTYDYAFKSTVPAPGDDPASSGAWTRWYNSKVAKLAFEDRDVASVMWHCTNWLAPQTDMFSPWILWRLVWKGLRDSL